MGAGGTSFASPIMAGVQALINQKAGGPQGNPAPVYYQLAAGEYGSVGNSSCNSDHGNAVASSCIFYDVTSGDMDVDCVGPNCFLADGSVGVLSTSNSSFLPAYGTGVGWDFATGIGTINAANLVNNWPVAAPQPNFTLSASPASLAVVQGSSGFSSISVAPQNGFAGNVTFSATGLPSGVTASFTSNPDPTSTTLTLSAGATAAIGMFAVTVIGTSGNITSQTTISLTVNPAGNYTLSAAPSTVSITQGTSGASTITINPLNGFASSVSLTASGLPSGVTGSFNPTNTTGTSTLTLTASLTAATGTFTVTITGTSGNLIYSTDISLTVNAAPNFTLSVSPTTLSIGRGTQGSATVTITPSNGFTGNVGLSASGLPKGVTASFSPNPAAASSTLTLRASAAAARGTFLVTITGTSAGLTHKATVTLTVHR